MIVPGPATRILLAPGPTDLRALRHGFAGRIHLNGRGVVTTHQGDRWTFQNFVNSPDPRFRQIVKRFADAGYLDAERDEFKII